MGKTATAPVVKLAPPTLPQASAAGLAGLPITPSPPGPGGQTGFSISLPITPGRGYAPQMALSSGGGNGPFGLGWHTGAPSIRRRTDRGVPTYAHSSGVDETYTPDPDTYIGPNGDILVPDAKPPEFRVSPAFDRTTTYTVTRYFPRVEGTFGHIEHWFSPTTPHLAAKDFWLVYGADGSLLCLGRTTAARIADPNDSSRVVEWLSEESVSADGQHIYYCYGDATATGALDSAGRDTQANRYLTRVCYGNVTANENLFLWTSDTEPASQTWLFTLLFDYGAPTAPAVKPELIDALNTSPWPPRQDAFSHYDAGFEVRTHFLCRQVLMFHQFEELGTSPFLVNRLLLEYEERPACSRLIGARLLAYEADGTVQQLPPLDIHWSDDLSLPDSPDWQLLQQPLTLPVAGATPELDPMGYHQTDLYSEGMSGLLYQEGDCWYYRRPIRDQRSGAAPDAITYGPRELLPVVPTLQGAPGASLVDINGDGQLEWLVTIPGAVSGYYSMQPDRTWTSFTPLTQLPLEVLQPYAMHTDVHGAGLSDLVVLSPKSVRYYANKSTYAQVSFDPPIDVPQADGVVLPMPGRNPLEWVGFADVLGSGQAHLVSIRPDTTTCSVTCWPWLGNGRFGMPLVLATDLPFARNKFDPRRVSLVSLYGPGAPDLVYADTDALKIFRNQGGNRFDCTPTSISYPSDVHMGSLTQIGFSDLSGRGVTSALLTQNFGGQNNAVRHWRLDFYPSSPSYQLTSVDNNTGARCDLTWRYSIQDWVDEKIEDSQAISGLPSSSMLIGSIALQDGITGWQSLITASKYRRGVWDGHERESRGYSYMETLESATVIESGANVDGTAPHITRSWYHTGRSADAYPDPYRAPYACLQDPQAYPQTDTRLTTFNASPPDANPWHDVPYLRPTANTQWWMHRSLKGSLLRSEQYDATRLLQPESNCVPYAVQYNRWQVREVQPSTATPVVLPMELEQFSYRYDQVMEDPLITQTVAMDSDASGYALWTVDIAYPRRLAKTAKNPYAALPWPPSGNPDEKGAPASQVISDNSWQATFDDQQTQLRLTENRFDVSRTEPNNTIVAVWRMGILNASRQNALVYAARDVPAGGLTAENLGDFSQPACLLGPEQDRTLQAQSVITYQPGTPENLTLVAHTSTALLTRVDMAVIDSSSEPPLSTRGGYTLDNAVLAVPGVEQEPQVWTGKFGITTYDTPDKFWVPLSQQTTSLQGDDSQPPITDYTWDSARCAVKTATDAYSNIIDATIIDYRFLSPRKITDPNMNVSEVQQDALGRVVATSYFGTQLSGSSKVEQVGFDDIIAHPADVHQTVSDAIDSTLPQPEATRTIYDGLSWMGQLAAFQLDAAEPGSPPDALLAKLVELGFLTSDGRIRSRGRRWARAKGRLAGIPDAVRDLLAVAPSTPVHSVTLVADAWPSVDTQAIRATLVHTDAYGRTLSTATRVPAGPAFQRTSTGDLVPDANAIPPFESSSAPHRWAVTGTARYSPAGQVINAWPPFFVNDWGFINYGVLPIADYADTYYYDAAGREIQVTTGLNFLRKTSYAPWFTISEDENDLQDQQVIPPVVHPSPRTLTIIDTNMATAESPRPATTESKLPVMQAACGAAAVANQIVLDNDANKLLICWEPDAPPGTTSEITTVTVTNNSFFTATFKFDFSNQTINMDLNVNCDGQGPYKVIDMSPLSPPPITVFLGFVNNTINNKILIPTPSQNPTSRITCQLPTDNFNWDSFDLRSIMLYYNPNRRDPQPIAMCTPDILLKLDGEPSTIWQKIIQTNTPETSPYFVTSNLITSGLPTHYSMAIAQGNTDNRLQESDKATSYTQGASIETTVPIDADTDLHFYTGIIERDDNNIEVAASWRRAFCSLASASSPSK